LEGLNVNGSVAVTFQGDSHGNYTGNVSVAPVGSITGTYKAIDDWLLIDASANFNQGYVTPFGPQPHDLVNDTANRYMSQTFMVSPHATGVLPGEVTYTIRDDNVFTTSNSFGSTAVKPPTTYTNTANVNLSSVRTRVGWTVDYTRSYYDSGVPGGTSWTDSVRASFPVRLTDDFRFGPRVGYERASLLGEHFESTIYGVEGQWTPTDRTAVNGYWEHRFFGDGYSLGISHRLPRIALSASFSRDLTNYAQLALTIPPTENVSSFVDASLRTRIPDPTQRATAVQQFLARSGLPTTLFGPVNFYSSTFLLQTSETISTAWLGTKDSITFSLYRVKSESLVGQDPALEGSFLPEGAQFSPNNTQIGAGVGYGRSLTSQTSLSLAGSVSRVTDDSGGNTVTHAVNSYLSASLNTTLTPRTSGSIGTTYSWYSPSGSADFHNTSAWNVYAVISHTFR
jgi:uncharacterized protein (PEP-CTERM system associated)